MSSHVEIDHSERVVSQVIRFLERGPSGSCSRDLHVRFDWTFNGWSATFYHSRSSAESCHGRMDGIPTTHAAMAIKALEMLQKLHGKGPSVEYEGEDQP